jgi:hypothetical protein
VVTRVMRAMFAMTKFDVAALEKARAGARALDRYDNGHRAYQRR